MGGGSFAWRRLMEYLDENRDAFNNDVSQTTNVLDLPAHYPYSPERWRIYVDGSRVQPMYDTVPQYEHRDDKHALIPNAGETVVFRSAERPRYVVSFELAASFAMQLNQELQTGDSIRSGLYDGADGWYFEQTGSHDPGEADFVSERAGTVQYRREDQDLFIPTTQLGRFLLQTAWYNISRQQWERSYPETDPPANAPDNDLWTQQNRKITTGAMQNGDGPRTGNLPVYFEVTASADTTTLELLAGSAAQVNLGDTMQFNRIKKFFAEDPITVTGAWEPLRAYRIDPDRDIINTQIQSVNVAKYTSSADVEMLIMAADKSRVLDADGNELTDADFAAPPEASATNNILEESTAVEQFPDNTGTPQTSMANPGGWQLGRAELLNASGNQVASTVSLESNAKRPFYSLDYAVVLGKSANTGDMSYALQAPQDW